MKRHPSRPVPQPLKHLRYACGPMTVCIAALADDGRSLVMTCDSMLSSESFSADHTAVKMHVLTAPFPWWIMAAGDVSHTIPVIELAGLKLLAMTETTNTREFVERAVVSAYQGVYRQVAEDVVLTPLGFDWEYLQRGESSIVGKLMEKLEQVNLGCEFLVAGFDWNGDGYIFSVMHPGTAKNRNVCGYEAIGTGAYNALAILMHHSVNQEMKLAQVLYHVCEAKFMAESADGVGRHTHVKVARGVNKTDPYELSGQFIDLIRETWEKDGKPRLPNGIINTLDRQLDKLPGLRIRPVD
jgi:hypothetical protein